MNERIEELFEKAHIIKPKMVVDPETFEMIQAKFNGKPMETKVFDHKLFGELVWKDGYKAGMTAMVNAQWSDSEFMKIMDAYYEKKWAHRFDN